MCFKILSVIVLYIAILGRTDQESAKNSIKILKYSVVCSKCFLMFVSNIINATDCVLG